MKAISGQVIVKQPFWYREDAEDLVLVTSEKKNAALAIDEITLQDATPAWEELSVLAHGHIDSPLGRLPFRISKNRVTEGLAVAPLSELTVFSKPVRAQLLRHFEAEQARKEITQA